MQLNSEATCGNQTTVPRPMSLRRRLAHTLLSTSLFAISVLLVGQSVADRFLTGHNDFLQLYSGSALVGTPGLYSFDANKEVQMQRAGIWLHGVYYSRLPFYAQVLSPLSRLPYAKAYWLFQLASVVSFAVFVFCFLAEWSRLAPWAPVFLPLIMSVVVGQDLTFVLLFASLFLVTASKGHDTLAGVFLALCLIKFHLFVFVPFVLLAYNRRRLFWSATAGVAILLGISSFAAGFDWPIRYLAALVAPELHPTPDRMPSILGALRSLGVRRWVEIATFLGGAVILCWMIVRAGDFCIALGLSLLGGLALAPHVYIQDCALLLLIVPLLAPKVETLFGRALVILLLSPIPYILLLRGLPGNLCAPLLFIALAWMGNRVTAGAKRPSSPRLAGS